MKAIQAGCAVLGAEHGMTDLTDAGEALKAIARLISQMPTIVAAFFRLRNGQEPVALKDLSHAANFLYMLDGEEPQSTLAKTMDVARSPHGTHHEREHVYGAGCGLNHGWSHAVVSSAIGSLTGRSTVGQTNERYESSHDSGCRRSHRR